MSCNLELPGHKWILRVARDLMPGKHTYDELQHAPEGMPASIPANCLKCLLAACIINKSCYRERPLRYTCRLTDKGRGLRRVTGVIIDRDNRHIPGTLSHTHLEAPLGEKSR